MVALFIISFIIFTALSALCSASETGVYRISKVNLRVEAEHGNKLSILLRNMLEDTNALIYSILLANNVFNYAATMMATFVFVAYSKQNPEYYATMFTIPILFVFGEVLPKNLFYIRADALMNFVTLPLWIIHRFFCLLGITPLMDKLAAVIAKIFRMPSNARSFSNVRSTINIISDETHHEGLFSRVQWDIMNRLTCISHTTISTVMVSFDSAVMVSADATKKVLMDMLTKYPYTRLIVYKGDRHNIIGYVNVYKALNCNEEAFDLSRFVNIIKPLSADTTVIDAIKAMHNQGLRIAMVTNQNRNIGFITIKDLAEELTGELSVY